MPKPFITYQQQIALLKSKNLIFSDEAEAEHILANLGYFTLIGCSNTLSWNARQASAVGWRRLCSNGIQRKRVDREAAVITAEGNHHEG